MRRPRVDALPVRAALWTAVAALGLTLIGAPANAQQPAASTTVSCLPEPQQVAPEDVARLDALARKKLLAAATPSYKRYPFGALRAESTYQRMKGDKWASGFFTASLWREYERTHAKKYLTKARAFTEGLLPQAFNTNTHDLGFMVGLPAGLGARLDPDPSRRQRYHDAVVNAARTLAKRYDPKVQAIKSADYDGKWGVIIDSAMNAPLLIEVGQELGGDEGQKLIDIGTAHMRTLARDFIRPNGSTYHRMAYDPQTGALIGPMPGQGLDGEKSTWSRGQAWAINGFTRAYELTKDPTFKDAAKRTASFWMTTRQGCVPAWDFDVTNSRSPMDSGAAAIAADGLLRLDAVDPSIGAGSYARYLLGTLTAPWWLSSYSINPGLLLQQTLNVNSDPREGSYVWGDYYLLSAIAQL